MGALYFFGFLIWVLVSLIPAGIASRKGHSALAFWLFAFFLALLPALIVALVIRPVAESSEWIQEGSIVKLVHDVPIDTGQTLRAGYVARVLRVDVHNQAVVLLIDDGSGSPVFVYRNSARLA